MAYRCVTDLTSVKNYLQNAGVVAFDFETAPLLQYRADPRAALDANRACIVGISLSAQEGTGIYIPLQHFDGDNADAAEILPYLRDALWMKATIIKVAHNLAFESMFLYALGIALQPPCYDTIAAARLTQKGKEEFRVLKDCGLKTLAAQLLQEDMPSFDTVTEGAFFDELYSHDPETVRYACADSDMALRLYYLFNAWFDAYLPRHRYVVEMLESPTAVYCGIMKYNGLQIDLEGLRLKKAQAEDRLSGLREQIAFIIGGVELGANASTAAFKRYLYEDMGLPVLKSTAKNKEAADDQTMVMLAEWCALNRPELVPLFELVQEYRKWGKISSTYIDGYLKHLNPATGRIHPDLLPLGTDTGRFASRNPNLQNAPRKDNDPIGIRSCIIAPEGKLLLSLDFSQIELRVGAFFCRDERMLETYRQNGDIHAQTTAVIFGIPYKQAVDKNAHGYKERRTIAKNVNFGVFYGLFAKGLQRTLRYKAGMAKELPECERIIRNLMTGYPRLSAWQREVKQKAALRSYSETWLGRRRYLPGIRSQDWGRRSFAERCAMNTPIQGTAADILKLALERILFGLPERPWLKPLLQIHDELVFEIPAGRLEEATAFVKACMERQPFGDFDVPIIAEAASGPNFEHMEEA